MTILIAPDKYKGSLTAMEACRAIQKGIHRFDKGISTVLHPLADGGEGSLETLNEIFHFTSITMESLDALGRPVTSVYKRAGNAAYIELSNASGLMMLPSKGRNPMLTSTLGTGMQILHALQNGVKKIYVFLGGSATNDGGMGIAHALGYRFTDVYGRELPPLGINLRAVHHIEDKNLIFQPNDIEVIALCDVDNPFHGPTGASHVYASQKGANLEEIKLLDEGLKNLSKVIQKKYNLDVQTIAGSGAAGGAAGGLFAFMHATLQSGAQVISQLTGLEDAIQSSDYVITGEGKLDEQSLHGKTVAEVARLAYKHHKPMCILTGKNELTKKQVQQLHPQDVISIVESVGFDEEKAIAHARLHLENLAFRWVRCQTRV